MYIIYVTPQSDTYTANNYANDINLVAMKLERLIMVTS